MMDNQPDRTVGTILDEPETSISNKMKQPTINSDLNWLHTRTVKRGEFPSNWNRYIIAVLTIFFFNGP